MYMYMYMMYMHVHVHVHAPQRHQSLPSHLPAEQYDKREKGERRGAWKKQKHLLECTLYVLPLTSRDALTAQGPMA